MSKSFSVVASLFLVGFWWFPWWGSHGSNQSATVHTSSSTTVHSTITAVSGNTVVITQH